MLQVTKLTAAFLGNCVGWSATQTPAQARVHELGYDPGVAMAFAIKEFEYVFSLKEIPSHVESHRARVAQNAVKRRSPSQPLGPRSRSSSRRRKSTQGELAPPRQMRNLLTSVDLGRGKLAVPVPRGRPAHGVLGSTGGKICEIGLQQLSSPHVRSRPSTLTWHCCLPLLYGILAATMLQEALSS